MMKQEIPCVFYLHLHSKLYKKANGQPIRIKEAKKYMFRWNIPDKIRPLIIKEMEIIGLVKKEGIRLIIERPKFDIEDCNGYYKILGFY